MALRIAKNKSDLMMLASETDNIDTKSSKEQKDKEDLIKHIYRAKLMSDKVIEHRSRLTRKLHTGFLRAAIRTLPTGFQSLDASHPWLCYWIIHSLGLLGEYIPTDQASCIVKFLSSCQVTSGGFAGGPGQIAHLATTYSAVMALCSIETEEAYNAIDRAALQR